jgi:hypothetical protein
MKSKYESLPEWKKADPKAYEFARKNNFLDDICENFGWIRIKKQSGYWTKEKCIESARRFNTRSEWYDGCKSSSTAARRNGWIDECCAHMESKIKPNGYWTIELCKIEALKYEGRWDWQKGHTSSYSQAKIKGWLDECCAHMESKSKPNGYWSKEKCMNEAKKHKYASDWEHACGSSYGCSRTNGWYDECISHMGRKIKKTGYWTKERCMAEAKKYQYKEEWKKNSYSSHSSARRNGWYKECSEHMTPIKFKWNKESLLEEANKYKTTSEFLKYSNGAYQTAIKLDCLDYVTQNLKNTRQIKWTIEKCKLESIKYNTRGEWQKKSNTSYNAARKYNWLDECCTHMINGKLKNNKSNGNIEE